MAQEVREFASSSENLSPLPGPTWWEKEPAPEGHSVISTHMMFKIKNKKIKIKTTRHKACGHSSRKVAGRQLLPGQKGPWASSLGDSSVLNTEVALKFASSNL